MLHVGLNTQPQVVLKYRRYEYLGHPKQLMEVKGKYLKEHLGLKNTKANPNNF